MRIIFLTLALSVLAGCAGESSDTYLDRARDYLAAPDYPAAIVELKNALKLDTESAEARWLLAEAYLETGQILSAEKELRRAETLGWSADDIRPALAKILLAQGKVDDTLALEHEDISPVAAARLLSTQAMAALTGQDTDTALELVELALQKAPQLHEARLAQATVAVRIGDTDTALALIATMEKEAPDDGGAQWLKAHALLQRGELEAARATIDASIEKSATATPADLILRALLSVHLRDYETAQADARAVLEISPEEPTANYIVGVRYFQIGEHFNAISALNLARPVAEQFPLVLYYLGSSYLVEKNLNHAEEAAGAFYTRVPDDINGRKLYAAILLQLADYRRALEVLQPVIDYNPADVQALNLKANMLLLNGQADIGMLLYARIAQLQPDWLIMPLPPEDESVWTEGTEEQAEPEEAESVDTANFPQTDILSILNHLARRDYSSAIDAAKSYQSRTPADPVAHNVLGRVYFAAKQPNEGMAVFEEVLQQDPGNRSANWAMAELALAGGDPDRARRYYEEVLEFNRDDLETLLKLAELETGRGNTEDALESLNQAAEVYPGALEPRLGLAEHYMLTGKPEKVVPLFVRLSALQRRSPRVLELTAQAQLVREHYADALTTLQQLVQESPASADAHYMLAFAANALGDGPRSEQALLRTIEIDPDHFPALLGLAESARLEGDQERFHQYLSTLVGLSPDVPEVLRLRALSAQAAGNTLEAVALSRQAYARAPTTRAVMELASLQKAAGQYEAARDSLQQWISRHPDDIDARLFLANTMLDQQDEPGARELYLAVLELDPDNATALNNLAWALKQEDPAKALGYIQRASALAPEQPELLDTLAVVEFYNGDYASARRNVQRALAALPDNPTVRYHDAMIAAALGDRKQAIATLEELLKRDVSDFPERTEAQELLAQLRG